MNVYIEMKARKTLLAFTIYHKYVACIQKIDSSNN